MRVYAHINMHNMCCSKGTNRCAQRMSACMILMRATNVFCITFLITRNALVVQFLCVDVYMALR